MRHASSETHVHIFNNFELDIYIRSTAMSLVAGAH